jgi:FG-GAP-like repeat
MLRIKLAGIVSIMQPGWLILLTVGTMAAETLSFTPLTLPAGSSPAGVRVADFNADGRPDIVVVNTAGANQNHVTVLLGEGGWRFSSPVSSATGGLGSAALTIGDFNGDGKPDVAVANNLSNDVSMLLGNGDGTFQAPLIHGVHRGPVALVTADFNRDGYLDLAVLNSFTGDITLLLGMGDGSFRSGHQISVGSAPTDLKVADFNGDGVLDLAVANGSLGERQVLTLLGNGDGTFRTAGTTRVGNEPFSLSVGDFNHDGAPDLVVANLASSNVSVLLGKGDGAFQTATNYATTYGPVAVVHGGFSVGRNMGFAVCSHVYGQVQVFAGDGSGAFQPPVTFPARGPCNSLAVGDLGSHGRIDIATANDNNVVVLVNTSQP